MNYLISEFITYNEIMNFNNIMKFTDIKITYPQLLKNLEITESMYDAHFTLWHKKNIP